MGWEEWERLKAQAADRAKASTDAGAEASASSLHEAMRLNQLPADQGPGAPDLRVQHQQLRALGSLAADLRERLRVHGGHARRGTSAAGAGLAGDGLDCGPQVSRLVEVWDTKLNVLLDACARIDVHLRFTSSQHHKDDTAVEAGMGSVDADLLPVSELSKYIK